MRHCLPRVAGYGRCLRVVAGVVAAGVLATTGALARPPAGRALFVRDESLVTNRDKAAQLLDFCVAKRVKLLLVSAADPSQQADRWADFLQRAHSRELTVHALGGQPEWGLAAGSEERPGRGFGPKPPFEHLNRILTFNLPRPSGQRFDGVLHEIDVWATERYRQADQAAQHDILSFYIETLCGCWEAVQRLGQPLDYGAVLPPDADTVVTRAWEDEHKEKHEYTGPAYVHVAGIVDYVVVRDYADTEDRLLDAARDELRAASGYNGAAYIAVQTAAADGVPAAATFSDEGEAAMEDVLATVTAAFAEHKAFRGVAIDCYETYRALKP